VSRQVKVVVTDPDLLYAALGARSPSPPPRNGWLIDATLVDPLIEAKLALAEAYVAYELCCDRYAEVGVEDNRGPEWVACEAAHRVRDAAFDALRALEETL
jgi:hypothetical protein